ncbi:GNAT family N-acetyltransferase [Meridianimarinicoccus aquatilis]|uniref:GNAT family N-acetyltransferase n=1 Tax=Meridianimarinicoccus aquatilis TaxID=2552766 RepID=A0A4R6AU81_9RHOB|nr:GNAT family N-acetyltransferase [Fluviibacterium aquatile]TDL87740.1 GNAT family N-acetyltransferase [Fluviibacterium aquatile]
MSVIYRTMMADELPIALEWAAREGWNPGHDDAAPFFAADPDGFFVAVENDTPVAAISVVNHDPSFAFLGLYIVEPAWRGKGIGFTLWDYAMQHAGPRTVGLDGVRDQEQNYQVSGFVSAGQTARFEGQVTGQECNNVRCVRPTDLPGLIAMDTAANGYNKSAFLKAWLTDTTTRKTLVLDRDGKMMGFVTLRACRTSTKIGPLIATTDNDAEILLRAAAAATGDGPVTIDVPDSQQGLTSLCLAEGMTCGFSTARMYRGPAPKAQPMVASVATLELG